MLAIAGLAIGAFSAVALAHQGQKRGAPCLLPRCFPYETKIFLDTITFDRSGNVNAAGNFYQLGVTPPGCPGARCELHCWQSRSMRLQLLNGNGVVLTTLDSSTSAHGGYWTLSGQLPTTLPAGTNYVRVKAKKRTVDTPGKKRKTQKVVCQAAVTQKMAIPAA